MAHLKTNGESILAGVMNIVYIGLPVFLLLHSHPGAHRHLFVPGRKTYIDN